MKNTGAVAESSHRCLQCRPTPNSGLARAEGQTARGDSALREDDHRGPAENWKATGEVTPLQNAPRQAPCLEAAGVIASSEQPQIDHVATRVRTALARARAPVQRSAKRERGSTQFAAASNQFAAASKKPHQKVRLSQR
jgi:hypothetical protein